MKQLMLILAVILVGGCSLKEKAIPPGTDCVQRAVLMDKVLIESGISNSFLSKSKKTKWYVYQDKDVLWLVFCGKKPMPESIEDQHSTPQGTSLHYKPEEQQFEGLDGFRYRLEGWNASTSYLVGMMRNMGYGGIQISK